MPYSLCKILDSWDEWKRWVAIASWKSIRTSMHVQCTSYFWHTPKRISNLKLSWLKSIRERFRLRWENEFNLIRSIICTCAVNGCILTRDEGIRIATQARIMFWRCMQQSPLLAITLERKNKLKNKLQSTRVIRYTTRFVCATNLNCTQIKWMRTLDLEHIVNTFTAFKYCVPSIRRAEGGGRIVRTT